MATAALATPSTEQRERRFFLVMALIVAATVVSGFGIRIVLGVTSFSTEPWWTHVHAVSFMAWIGFYVLQNLLVVLGDTKRHMQLGKIGAVMVLWIWLAGIGVTTMNLAVGAFPRFFEPTYFLAQNSLTVTFFAGLTCAAVALRHRPDWHRRLMLCATLVVCVPGFARWVILIAPPPNATTHLISVAIFLVPAMAFDFVTRGKIHAAYWLGGGSILLMKGLTPMLAAFPPFAALASTIAE